MLNFDHDLLAKLGSVPINPWPVEGTFSTDGDTVIGRGGWAFLYRCSNDYFHGYSPLEDDERLGARWASNIGRWRESVEQRGVKFAVAIVPNKASLLPHAYPVNLPQKITGRARCLLDRLRPEDRTVWDSFINSQAKESLFRRNDTHLTEAGNLILASHLLAQLELPEVDIAFHCKAMSHTGHAGDIGRRFDPVAKETLTRLYHDWTLFCSETLSGPIHQDGVLGISYQLVHQKPRTKARLMVFGNSFIERVPSWGAAPFLAASVAEMRFSWLPYVDLVMIDEWKPSHVIFQTCERFLSRTT